MDIDENPAKYVAIATGVAEGGTIVQVENKAGVDLVDVLVQVEIEQGGRTRQDTLRVAQLPATQPSQTRVGGVVKSAYAVSAKVR